MRRVLLAASLLLVGAGLSLAASVGVKERLGSKVAADALFVDELGGPIQLRRLLGKPTVLTLNYFRCTGICSPLLNGVIDAVNGLGLEPEKDYRIVTVSFDERDKPEIARKKRENLIKQLKRPFPPSAWRLLTGSGPSIAALTASVGFEYKAVGKEFAHPGVIVVLSPDGVVTRYMYGVRFPAADLEMALREAAKGQARPTVVKALEFCLAFDLDSRELVLKATRIVGVLTLLVAIVFVIVLITRGGPPEKVSR